jgi:hypothetical protein
MEINYRKNAVNVNFNIFSMLIKYCVCRCPLEAIMRKNLIELWTLYGDLKSGIIFTFLMNFSIFKKDRNIFLNTKFD